MANGKGRQKQQVDLLPERPPPSSNPPGTKVLLATNLFRISLKAKPPKQIFCHTIQIDCDTKQPSGDKEQSAVPRRIPKDLRVQAVKVAVEEWMRINGDKLEADSRRYVLDSNGSTMYALFKMLDTHDGSSGKRAHLEVRAAIKSTRIVDKKAVLVPETMSVRFYSPSSVNVRGLVDYCAGEQPRANAEVEATLKTLNTILTAEILSVPGYVSMQAKSGSYSVFHFNQKSQFPISEGIFCNRGFISSVRPTETGIVANIANTVVPFYEPILIIDMLKRRFRWQDFSKELPKRIIDELKKELRTKQVEATHKNYGKPNKPHYRKYRVHDIGKSTIKEKFELEDPKTGKKDIVSVFDYFKREYPEYTLKYPNLPCLIDDNRKIPLEICRLVEKQKVNRKLNPLETREVIREAAVKPDKYFEFVGDNVAVLGEHDQPFKDFGFKLEMKPIELWGRVLPSIRLCAAGGQILKTRDGEYHADDEKKCGKAPPIPKFIKAATVPKWALVVLADDTFQGDFRSSEKFVNECFKNEGFAQRYCHSGRMKGVDIAPLARDGLHIIQLGSKDQNKLKKELRAEYVRLNRENYIHAIVILPGKKMEWIYGYLKYLEVDMRKEVKENGRCTRASSVKYKKFVEKALKGDNQSASKFLSNLWLKYNTKLGGINYVLDPTQGFSIDKKENFQNFLADGYLFVSIDVCHPAPGDKLEQSVAAAVGLWGFTSSEMSSCTRVRVQRKDKSDTGSTVEQVLEIGVMFQDILESYQKSKRKPPSNIVILRDGVSEGQFRMVLKEELSQIKASIKNFYDKAKERTPLLTCLTVQKRHKTRFWLKVPVQTRKGPDFNAQPGTVVDIIIVEPDCHSFYSVPHKAIQGIARAPHVYMIHDKIMFSQDSAQAMIFALSYLSPRCTKGTSIPTPVNLADLAAERGKNIVVSWNEDNPQKMSPEERLAKLNAFLSTMGDPTYQETLYYV